MCKLKAAITWEHSRRSNPIELFPHSFHDFAEKNEELSEEPKELSEELEELNVWVDISTSEIEEITQIYEDEDEMLTSEVEDIDHPALDSKAKWDLRTLFNNELQLSF
ncbi:hypothetical protein F8M41_018278 [Gigaspora margarita]|uniref:Uncharacterized protein n=1 Tax=Gigaspora margarita TaxID=4874 RepID=A0A8H4ELG8_GIGMA|nr:hypothetical protein F8M41_018278 [Gigaspora margarita]